MGYFKQLWLQIQSDNKMGYSFTFTIPPLKKVYYNGKRRPFQSLAFSHQYKFMEQLMMKIINPLEFLFIDWCYEFHEVGERRLHIHGYAAVSLDHESAVYKLRDLFYTYNSIIRLKQYKNISDIQLTYWDVSYWDTYCEKHQDTIQYFSAYRAEQKYKDALDNGIVQIYTNTDYDRYCDSLTEHLEKRETVDGYDFGKFIVEL